MKLAVQIGLPWLIGTLGTLTVGVFVWLAFAVEFLPGVLFSMGGLTVVMAAIGFAAVEGHWAWRIGWGVLVAVIGFVGVTFLYMAIDDTKLDGEPYAWVLVGLPFSIAGALLSRNWWARGAGALALVICLLLVPGDTYAEFGTLWSSLHF